MTDALPDGQAQRVLNKLCPGGIAQVTPRRVAGLASPLLQGGEVCNINFRKILENIVNLDEAGLDGFKRLAKAGVDEGALAKLLADYADNPQLLNQGLGILNKANFEKWTGNTLERMFKFMDDFGAEYTESFLKRVSTNIDDANFDVQFRRMLGRLDEDAALRQMLDPNVPDEIADGVAQLLRKAEHPNTWPAGRYGHNFQLERAKHYYGGGRLKGVELREEVGDGIQNAYDLVLDNVKTGDVIEVKYWQKRTVFDKVDQLADQFDRYVQSGRQVVVEFGETAGNPMTKSAIAELKELLAERGVLVEQIKFVLIER